MPDWFDGRTGATGCWGSTSKWAAGRGTTDHDEEETGDILEDAKLAP
jgi:hypothetical protein